MRLQITATALLLAVGFPLAIATGRHGSHEHEYPPHHRPDPYPEDKPSAFPYYGKPTGSNPPSLEVALIEAGCTKFLAWIKESPEAWALYTSGAVKTVYAPSDKYWVEPPAERRRKLAKTAARKAYQASNAINNLQKDGVDQTFNDNANLDGGNQTAVADTNPTSGGTKKRNYGPRVPIAEISTGLGSLANVKVANIPFIGGVIHVTDSLFTRPELLTATTGLLNEGTTFAALAAQENLSSLFDNTPRLTIFVPTNAAVAASGLANSAAGTAASALQAHVVHGIDVTGRVGYGPDLENGMVLTALNGAALTITKQGEQIFVNGAKVTKPNIIVDNGVVHFVDQVL